MAASRRRRASRPNATRSTRAAGARRPRAGARALARGPLRVLPADRHQLVGGAVLPLRGRRRRAARAARVGAGIPPRGLARRAGRPGHPRRRAGRRARRALRRRAPRPPRDLRRRRPRARRPARRLRLALVTNGASCLQREKFAASGLADRFDAVVVSGELRTAKPDPAVYAHALDAVGARPGDAVMVGDSLPTTSTARRRPACARSGSTAPASRGQPTATTSSRSPTSTRCRAHWPRRWAASTRPTSRPLRRSVRAPDRVAALHAHADEDERGAHEHDEQRGAGERDRQRPR